MRTERFTGKEEKMLLKMEWVGEKSNTSYCWEYFPYHQKYQYLDASWENSKVCDLTTANLQKHPVDLSQSRRSQQCHPCLEIYFFLKKKISIKCSSFIGLFKLKMHLEMACISGKKYCYYNWTCKLSWTEEELIHTMWIPSKCLQMFLLWFYSPKGTWIISPGQDWTSGRTVSLQESNTLLKHQLSLWPVFKSLGTFLNNSMNNT